MARSLGTPTFASGIFLVHRSLASLVAIQVCSYMLLPQALLSASPAVDAKRFGPRLTALSIPSCMSIGYTPCMETKPSTMRFTPQDKALIERIKDLYGCSEGQGSSSD